MRLLYGLLQYTVIAGLVAAGSERAMAATFNLPLNGTFSIVGDLPASYNPSAFGPVEIEIQAIESFPLPAFNALILRPLPPFTSGRRIFQSSIKPVHLLRSQI